MAGEKKTRKVPGIPGKKTQRQAEFLKAMPTSRTLGEAAVKAGYSKKNPRQSGHQALQALRGRVPDLMDRLGFSEEKIIDIYLRDGLNATRTEFVREDVIEQKPLGKPKKGKPQRFKEVTRHVVNQYVMKDNMARLYAMDKAFLLHGSYAPRDPKEAAQMGVKVIVQNVFGPPRPPIDIKPGMQVPERILDATPTNGKKNGAPKKKAETNGHD
jgi:hypothetical protein